MNDRSTSLRNENELAARVRAQILRCVRARVPPDVAEDLAHDLLVELLARLTSGAVAPGAENAYVRAAAMNRARDWHRKESGTFERACVHGLDADDLASNDAHAEEMLVRDEEAREGRARIVALRERLARAPERYRTVISEVYLEEKPIEALVRREVERLPVVSPAELKRARDRVDKHLERARKWLRQALVAAT